MLVVLISFGQRNMVYVYLVDSYTEKETVSSLATKKHFVWH